MFLGLGAILLLIGAIWLIYLSFQLNTSTGMKVVWAVVNFFFQPIAGIVFLIVNKSGMVPVILCIVGFQLYGYGAFSAAGEMMKNLPK